MDKTLFPPATRAESLARLERFRSVANAYARERNFERPGHPAVSRLSPYLRCRLIQESEVCATLLKTHSFRAIEKYIQEVCWRTYWKGWLELHPGVWCQYRAQLRELQDTPPADLDSAQRGQTGIGCFDHWVRELLETGYLHNHARMWFASIWIFTLKLPWQLGADFFYRHLLDADPASNTLSWRWVAGLQTVGKHYLARAENIRKYTEGRFDPSGQLDESATPLPPESPPPRRPLPQADTLPPAGDGTRRGLLVLGDDLSPEISPLRGLRIHSAAGGLLSDFPGSDLSRAFLEEAFADAAQRVEAHFDCPFVRLDPSARHQHVRDWVEREGLEEVVVLTPTTGPWEEDPVLANLPCPLRRLRRAWDEALYPLATAGFFRFKQKALSETSFRRLLHQTTS